MIITFPGALIKRLREKIAGCTLFFLAACGGSEFTENGIFPPLAGRYHFPLKYKAETGKNCGLLAVGRKVWYNGSISLITCKMKGSIAMKVEINVCNRFFVKGRVARLNVYGKGKACNVVVAATNKDGSNDDFIYIKSFMPEVFDKLDVGMKVEVYGHIGSASYKDSEGETHYNNSNDLIADCILFDETKRETIRRAVKRAYDN